MTQMRDALGTVEYSYNRTAVTEITDRNGGKTRYHYDFLGNRTGTVSPEQYESGLETKYEYDAAGRLTRVSDPYGRQIQQYTYDEAGYITCSVDARAAQEAE